MSTDAPSIRPPRTSVMLRAHVFRAAGVPAASYRVVNLSQTGLCIAQPTDLAVDSAVVVSIGKVEHMPADVVWIRSGLAGLRFREPVNLEDARARGTQTGTLPPTAAGWLTQLDSPYR